jgi:hypothetical protein
MDMALDTAADRAIDLGQRLETILRRGHSYQNVAASDNSNVHNGDRIYVTYNVTYTTVSGDGSTPVCTDQLLPDVALKQSGHSSLSKRKRASDDGGQLVCKSRDNDCKALEAALANLGKSLNV